MIIGAAALPSFDVLPEPETAMAEFDASNYQPKKPGTRRLISRFNLSRRKKKKKKKKTFYTAFRTNISLIFLYIPKYIRLVQFFDSSNHGREYLGHRRLRRPVKQVVPRRRRSPSTSTLRLIIALASCQT